MQSPVFVVGSTGTVGCELVKRLLEMGLAVRGASRRPADAARRFAAGVEYVEFDLERPETHAQPLTGVRRVFLMARPGDDRSDRLAIPLVDEMKRQGVQHVVHLSAYGAERRDDFALRKTEMYLEASGIAYTHLRPNWFMQVFSSGPMLAQIRANSAIALPAADAKISYIDARDVAAVAAEALVGDVHRGKTYTLTGPESLEHREIASRISDATGRTVRYVAFEEEDARKAILSAGYPTEQAERLVGFYRLVRAGACAPTSPDVETVLGRPPLAFARFANDHASCWRD